MKVDSKECNHPIEAIKWNKYNKVNQCHKCGEKIKTAPCYVCGQGEGHNESLHKHIKGATDRFDKEFEGELFLGDLKIEEEEEVDRVMLKEFLKQELIKLYKKWRKGWRKHEEV